MRKVYKMFKAAAAAHARWEYETSLTILGDRRKMLILLLLALPVLVPAIAQAADLPPFLGGKSAYAPSFATSQIFLVSIVIGLCAGLITGCIGAGGGFIITPALMSAGVKGILAVGTDLFHIFAKSIMGTTVHKKLGNISVGLAIAFVAGSFIGVSGGGVINRALYMRNPVLSDTFISIIYVLLLGFLGFYALFDFLKSRKGPRRSGVAEAATGSELVDGTAAGETGGIKVKAVSSSSTGAVSGAPALPGLPGRLQSVHLPPMISFDHDIAPGGRRIPALFVAVCGSFVGFVAAIMGVGGGFLTFPMFVYGLGVSSFTTVGTDIFQIIFTAGYASISQYAIYGFIFYTLAMGLLLGSLVGVQIGALTTKVVKGVYIRGFYATVILAGFVNRLFVLPSKLSELGVVHVEKALGGVFTTVGNVLFFAIVGVFAVWVTYMFISNLGRLREEV